MTKMKKVISFFAGVGGIDIGFENTGNFDVVYANEIDKNARITYESNFNIKVDERDIREVRAQEIPNGDILVAGFPCQPFSVAGYRQGFEDERGNLFFETLRIILEKEPEVVFLENVKNMVTHDEGNTFKVIRESLELNGYYLKWAVLNAKDYGNIPQNRERIYIVGFRSKAAFDKFSFPDEIELQSTLTDYIDFTKKVEDKYYYSSEKNPTFYNKLEESIVSQEAVYQWRRQYVRENKSGVVPTLTANMGTGGHNVPLILSDYGIRKLTPRETFNVQGFPKDHVLPEGIADGQFYKQAGNSVVVPVIERIAEKIHLALMFVEEEASDIKNYALIYTKMNENNSGESFVLNSFDNLEKLKKHLKDNWIIPFTEEDYTLFMKKRATGTLYTISELRSKLKMIV